MNEQVLQGIFDMIQEYLPERWNKVILFVGYTQGSYTMKYYIDDIANKYVDCFKFKGVSRAELIKLFAKIDGILSEERESLEPSNKWSVMTMIVDNTGKVRAEYDYNDHSEDMISYEKEWKNKYL